mgnify:CR=1 FL=1
MAKTKAEVAKMVRAQKIKQFSKLTLEQRKIKNGEIMRSARRNTAVGKIELSVLKKLILPEQKANKARTELKKTVPTTKKKVSRAELDKARVALQKKPVPKGSHRMPDGSIMKDSAMPKKTPAPKKGLDKDLFFEGLAAMTDLAKSKKIKLTNERLNELPDRILRRLFVRVLTSEKWTGSMFDDDITYAPQKASAKRMKEFLTTTKLNRYINPVISEDLNPDIPRDGDMLSLGAKANKEYLGVLKINPPFYLIEDIPSLFIIDTIGGKEEEIGNIAPKDLKKTKVGWSATIKKVDADVGFQERMGLM